MATTLTSTVPGAVSVLQTHFQNVANANPAMEIGVYLGLPVAAVKNNYLMIGNYQDGKVLASYRQDWVGMPAATAVKSETYSLNCSLRAWAGSSDPLARQADAYTMIDGVLSELQSDPGGSGELTASGSWQVTEMEEAENGPLGESGWGVVFTFTVEVINVRI